MFADTLKSVSSNETPTNGFDGAANEEYFTALLNCAPVTSALTDRAPVAPAVEPTLAPVTDSSPTAQAPKRKQSTMLAELAADAELFCTPMGDAYASITVDGHSETWPVRAGTFRSWLLYRYYQEYESAPGSHAVQEALGLLSARAAFAGETQEVFTRLAGFGDAVYLNLADEAWRSVEITAGGWSVIDSAPVRFRRPNGMLALPVPEHGGSIAELRRFINVTDESFILICAWLIGAFRPRGPYPILAIHGEPGCAKTTICRILRALIDPNRAPLRTLPSDERDLMITAINSWVLAYDNLSYLSARHSDAFCKLATGGGHATRALYTDNEEVIFEAERPLLLNGIEELASRGDLADRAIIAMLPTIPEGSRKPEDHLWADFEEALPRILGAVLDAVSSAIAHVQDVELARLPRMADFAKWVTAAEPALGWDSGTFFAAYAGNRVQGHELALEASPVAPLIVKLAEGDGFIGTASQLLSELVDRDGTESPDRKMPKDGPRLAGHLRRLAPHLRSHGIVIEFDRPLPGTRSRRGIRIGAEATVATVATVAAKPNASRESDASDGSDGKSVSRSKDAAYNDRDRRTAHPYSPGATIALPPAEQQLLDEFVRRLDARERPLP